MRDHDEVPYVVIEKEGGVGLGAFILGALVGAGLALSDFGNDDAGVGCIGGRLHTQPEAQVKNGKDGPAQLYDPADVVGRPREGRYTRTADNLPDP